jgi:hypothetical protein
MKTMKNDEQVNKAAHYIVLVVSVTLFLAIFIGWQVGIGFLLGAIITTELIILHKKEKQ